MHPLEFEFSAEYYKNLPPSLQKEYDRKGFESEDVRVIFHTFVEKKETEVREEKLGQGLVYPDISTISWYMTWLEETGKLNASASQDPQWLNKVLAEGGKGLEPSQSLVAVQYAAQFSTKAAKPIPEDFELDDALYLWASNFYPWVDEERETTRFIFHAREKQLTSKNWVYSWMKWLAGCNYKEKR